MSGALNAVSALPEVTISGSLSIVSDAGAGTSLTILFNGGIRYAANGGFTVVPGWWRNALHGTSSIDGIGAGFEVQWVAISGTQVVSANDTWLALSSSRGFGPGFAPASCTGRIEIRRAGTSAVLGTLAVSITANT
jgi:hypothetical protein